MSRMSPAAEEELCELLADRLHTLLKEPNWDAFTLAADLARTVAEWLGDDDEDLWP